MSSNKLKVQAFRANDLSVDTGKQFELGKSWCDFFEIDKNVGEITFNLFFKPLCREHEYLENHQIDLQLSELTARQDRKAYANGARTGHSAIKEFFIEDLHLTSENNSNDYFAIYKASEFNYYLYYVPKLLHDNFLKLFESTCPTVTINRAEEKCGIENESLQQIFYGAPGTGKSHAANEVVAKYPETIRTTFHPDSDYSTFVGAYKPTMTKEKRYGLNGSNTVAFVYPEGNQKGEIIKEHKIEYKFVKQAFLKAYIKAWNLFKDSYYNGQELLPQFLVIEEINRGNCAQIFGDLFQLLDRKNGFSEYPIETDEDIQKALLEEEPEDGLSFGEEGLKLTAEQINYINQQFDKPNQPSLKVAEKIRLGQILVLPPNFYIWATMNTSDQSLFPIDSAFKRRWDWKYIPISEGCDKNGLPKKWKIEGDTQIFDWWSFIKNINDEIYDKTHSEDKKLGYYFCKPENDVIKVDTFVSKVLFYLWNDVFKDFASESSLFTESYDKFYDTDSKGKTFIIKEKVQALLVRLKVKVVGDIDENDNLDTNVENPQERIKNHFKLNDEGRFGKARIALEALKTYSNANPEKTGADIVEIWSVLGIANLIETSETHAERENRSSDQKMSEKWNELRLPNGEYIYITNQFPNNKIESFINAVNAQPWNIRIEKIVE